MIRVRGCRLLAGALIACAITLTCLTAAAQARTTRPAHSTQSSDGPSLQQAFGINFTGVVSQNNQWGQPSGAWAHRKPLGWVILIHGGAWWTVGPQSMLTGIAPYYNAKGWGTYTIDYRPGMSSVWDTVAAYDYMRQTLGPSVPICAYGQSAGGHLSLLLAAVRPSLDCVISEAGPTDLASMQYEPGYQPPGQPPVVENPAWLVANYTVPAFGQANLWDFSPIRLAHNYQLPMLLAGSSWDTLVPEPGQLKEMRQVHPQAEVMLLAGAPVKPGTFGNFTHAAVTPAARAAYDRASAALLLQGIAHARVRASAARAH